MVTGLSRTIGVARQTLYRWRERGRAAVEAAFAPVAPAPVATPDLTRRILTTLVAGHASDRGIQDCLAAEGRAVSLGTVAGVVQAAEQRALRVMAAPAAVGPRVLALDEIYGNNRHGATLSVVDALSGAVWATAGPVAVDGESWTLLLWEVQARGLRWAGTVSDGGLAMQQACAVVDPEGRHQRDIWHVLHVCAQVQGRLDRWVRSLEAQTATVARQAARVAAGGRARGKQPRTDMAEHASFVAHAQAIAAALAYLTGELRRLLGVVVLTPGGLMDSATRRTELETLLLLLADLRHQAPALPQAELTRLHKHLTGALPGLLTFTPAPGTRVRVLAHEQWGQTLGSAHLALVAWAWQRRAVLGPSTEQLLAGFPEDWRPAARVLLNTWDATVRASSLVENWHSLLRPHLAVHRTLSPGLLALLAVYHNHQVASRGAHAGLSPFQRSGLNEAPTDWLVALGYQSAHHACPTSVTAHPSDVQSEVA
ncbi:MAG TPA: hypothetical protein VNM16_06590 [Bacillota bacterium]|nr:hypothetical protein [Bacillota bacterium]